MAKKLKKSLTELNDKQKKALALIEVGSLSYREVAQEVGWSPDYLYDLIAGESAKCGSSATLFAAEVDRIMHHRSKNIRHKTKKLKEDVISVLHEYVQCVKKRKTVEREALKLNVSILNAIGKATPNVEIDKFTYTQGYSIEDLVNEFRRLKGLSVDGRGVLPTFTDRSGEIPGIEEPGDLT